MPTLTPARQSLSAGLIYATLLLATIAWTAANDSSYRELQVQYAVRAEMLEALRKRASANASTKLTPAANGDNATVAAATETIAASVLQRYLLDRLESASGTVQSVQAEPRRETMAPGLQRLSAQLSFDAPVAGLQRFLFDLETGLPFVFVDSISAQPAPAAQQGGRPGDKLRVVLTVTSYWKAREGSGAGR